MTRTASSCKLPRVHRAIFREDSLRRPFSWKLHGSKCDRLFRASSRFSPSIHLLVYRGPRRRSRIESTAVQWRRMRLEKSRSQQMLLDARLGTSADRGGCNRRGGVRLRALSRDLFFSSSPKHHSHDQFEAITTPLTSASSSGIFPEV